MTNYVNQRFQRFKFLFNFVFVLSVLLRVLHCERCRIRTRDHSLLDLYRPMSHPISKYLRVIFSILTNILYEFLLSR